MANQTPTEACIAALQACELVTNHYGGATMAGVQHVFLIAKMLKNTAAAGGLHGGLKHTIGEAICLAYLNRSYDDAAKEFEGKSIPL